MDSGAILTPQERPLRHRHMLKVQPLPQRRLRTAKALRATAPALPHFLFPYLPPGLELSLGKGQP